MGTCLNQAISESKGCGGTQGSEEEKLGGVT